MNELLNLSIKEIRKKYFDKQYIPSDYAKACIERINLLDRKYKPWEVWDKNIFLKQAKISDDYVKAGRCRELEGIPVGVKDIFNTNNFATEMGSPIWKDFTPGNDARSVFYLKEQGAIIPGKTVTAEFAVHTLDKTLNPHNIKHLPGTSSTGSAVSIALSMVPAAIGTQTAGSIVRPASFCGVYGCKPSYGLIPRTGLLKTTDTLDTVGFFVGKATDLDIMLDVLRVHGDNYPLSNSMLEDSQFQQKQPGKPWKVAFVKTHTWVYAAGYAREAIIRKADSLSKDRLIQLDEVELPDILSSTHRVHEIIYDKCLSYYFKDEFKKKTLVSTIMRRLIEYGNSITVKEFHNALKNQAEISSVMEDFLNKYDIIISLSTAGEAPLLGEIEKPDPALMWTLAYLPVVSVPAFISPKGLPFGMQVVSKRYRDLFLFRFINYLVSKGLIPEGSNPLLDL